MCNILLTLLRGFIPYKDYDYWLLFVIAVSILCQRNITLEEVQKGDTLLVDFCTTFERLCGKENFTINMHLHYHLKDCILDYGPVYSFWLFSFERLNGVLGSYCKDISLQLTRRFSMSSHCVSVDSWPAEYRDESYPMLARHSYNKGSLQATSFQQAL